MPACARRRIDPGMKSGHRGRCPHHASSVAERRRVRPPGAVHMASVERFYSNSSSFDHEATGILGAAFDMACALVGHSPQPTLTREAIAKAIVEAATQGERDLNRLRDVGLAAVGHAGRVK